MNDPSPVKKKVVPDITTSVVIKGRYVSKYGRSMLLKSEDNQRKALQMRSTGLVAWIATLHDCCDYM